MITREWAFSVGPGRWQCPQCGAGERACKVWDADGSRHVYCHRASCGASFRYPLVGSGSSNEKSATAAPTEVLRPYTGDRVPLRAGDRDVLKNAYEFVPDCQTVGYTTPYGQQHFLFPILAPNGSERGILEMRIKPKYRRIWKAKNEPMIHWTGYAGKHRETWIVEDIISAQKFTRVAGLPAVALLGTHLTQDAAAEIQRHADNVVIALDADATSKAFLMARKWGAAFKSCRVQILDKLDIKDMSFKDIQGIIDERYRDTFGSFGEQGGV